MIDLFGQVVVPVSRSVQRGKALSPTISATFGLPFSSSSHSADLQRSLESRLLQQMDERGSTSFTLTWKDQSTASGRRICALLASERNTSDKDCIGWPTPDVRMYRDLSKKGIAYAASRTRHQPSTVTTAYLKRYTNQQIPALLSGLMGFPDAWVSCAVTVTLSSRKSQQNSSKLTLQQQLEQTENEIAKLKSQL